MRRALVLSSVLIAASVQAGAPPREPTVDLNREAAQPRPGQITPGAARPPAGLPTPPAAAGADRAPTDAAQAAPHVFRERTAAQELAVLRASIRDEGVSAKVEASSGDGPAQWRADGGEWADTGTGTSRAGVLEVRTGLFRAVTFAVGDRAKVTVMRASRVVLKQVRVGEDKPNEPAPRRLVVEVKRGRVAVDPGPAPAGGAPEQVTITTPDWMAVTPDRLEVTHDPGRGTTTRYLPAR
jgi:hypothetical protein